MLLVCLSRDAYFLPAASFSKLEPPPSGVEDDDDFVILGRKDMFFRAALVLFNAEDEDEDEEEETNPHGCSKHLLQRNMTVPTWRRAENRKPRETRERRKVRRKYQERKRERERQKRQKKERLLKPKSIRGALVKYKTAWLKEEEEEQRKSFDDDDDDELCRNERVSPRFGAFEKRRQTGAPVGRDDVFFFFVN